MISGWSAKKNNVAIESRKDAFRRLIQHTMHAATADNPIKDRHEYRNTPSVALRVHSMHPLTINVNKTGYALEVTITSPWLIELYESGDRLPG